MMKLGF